MDCSGRRPRVQPADQRGLEDLQGVGRGGRPAGRAAHLGTSRRWCPTERSSRKCSGIPRRRRSPTPSSPPTVKTGPGRGVVDPGRARNVNPLVGAPAHRPVDLPGPSFPATSAIGHRGLPWAPPGRRFVGDPRWSSSSKPVTVVSSAPAGRRSTGPERISRPLVARVLRIVVVGPRRRLARAFRLVWYLASYRAPMSAPAAAWRG